MKRIVYIMLSFMLIFSLCGIMTAQASQENVTIAEAPGDVAGKEDTTEPPSEPVPDEKEEIEGVVSLDGKTIMIVGNSMVYYGNCVIHGDAGKEDYGYFYQLALSHGEKATVIDHTYAGKKLDYIYDNYLSKLSKEELSKVDYLVLSEGNQVNNDLLGTCKKILALFPESTQLRFLIQPMMFDSNMTCLIEGVADLRANGIEVVDWGKLVYDIYTGVTKVPGATLEFNRCSFMKDNLGYKNGKGAVASGQAGDRNHENPLSGYVTAQMLYTSITNRSAVLTDYTFCYNKEIHKYFDIDTFAKAHYTGTEKTNFPEIFRSPKDMYGLQQLIDIYLGKDGRHPLTVQEAVEPTCTRGGLTRGSFCSLCGEVAETQEFIPSNGGHKLVFKKAVSPTCTKKGKTAGISCDKCDEIILNQETIAATGHTSEKIVTGATTKADGTVKDVCTVCNKVLSSKKVKMIKSVTLSTTSYVYDGKSKKPSVTVKDSSGKKLVKNTDYTLSYASGRKEVGNYKVTVKFKGNYSGSKSLTFKIRPGATGTLKAKAYIKTVKLSWEKVEKATGYRIYVYDSAAKEYKKVADTSKTSYKIKELSSGQKYKFRIKAFTKSGDTVYYSAKNKNVTTMTKPSTVSLKSVSSSKSKTAAVSWNTVATAEGYQIAYSTSSTFERVKKVNFSKKSTKSATLQKLASGKTYYFKVRAYKTFDGKKIYGSYSEVKKVKIK